MKQFFKYVLATITGIVILFLFMLLMGVISIMSMSSQSSVKVKDGSVLEINLTGNMSERKEDNPLASLLGNPNANNISHENVMKAIKKAKEDEKIKGIYIQGGILTGATPAMLEEIHDALVDFKSSKKKIVAYADNYSQGSYYLASVADSIVINPLGMLNWDGLGLSDNVSQGHARQARRENGNIQGGHIQVGGRAVHAQRHERRKP